jgi:hypothetical protein
MFGPRNVLKASDGLSILSIVERKAANPENILRIDPFAVGTRGVVL